MYIYIIMYTYIYIYVCVCGYVYNICMHPEQVTSDTDGFRGLSLFQKAGSVNDCQRDNTSSGVPWGVSIVMGVPQ